MCAAQLNVLQNLNGQDIGLSVKITFFFFKDKIYLNDVCGM